MEPLAQLIRWRQIAQPGMQIGGFFLKPARPKAVHQHARPVLALGLLVDSLNRDRHGLSIMVRSGNGIKRRYATNQVTRKRLSPRLCVSVVILLFLAGLHRRRRKSDAELGLNPQQAAGRRVYDNYCARCHEAYSRATNRAQPAGSLQTSIPGSKRTARERPASRRDHSTLSDAPRCPAFSPVPSDRTPH